MMASKGNGLGNKSIRKRVAIENSSGEPTDLSSQKFSKGALIPYTYDWYDSQLEAKYLGDEYVNDGWCAKNILTFHARIQTLGLQYVFTDQGDGHTSRSVPLDSQCYVHASNGPAFQELIDDDYAMTDEEDGSAEDEFDVTKTRDNASDEA
ncbi:hypothetical protein EJD97_006664 [Solanum chilense]|uniref:Uncharacterized protein n=1 Tax=Solanum chilense TaxID=4083 RepID=A0A6N2BQ28_SOLCI|nr:hypothetical protein EJD97_006664 [Solanum chilense]